MIKKYSLKILHYKVFFIFCQENNKVPNGAPYKFADGGINTQSLRLPIILFLFSGCT